MADNNLTTKEEFLLNPVEEHNITDAAVASFETNLKHPLKVTVPITPQQDLHGYDRPWPAGASVNLIPDGTDTSNGYRNRSYLDVNGNEVSNSGTAISEYFNILENEEYTWNCSNKTLSSGAVCFYDENKEFISGVAGLGVFPQVITTPIGAIYCRITIVTASSYKNQFEKGTTATAYVPHSNICQISGWTEENIYGRGKNLFDSNFWGLVSSYPRSGNYGYKYSNYIKLAPNTTYRLSVQGSGTDENIPQNYGIKIASDINPQNPTSDAGPGSWIVSNHIIQQDFTFTTGVSGCVAFRSLGTTSESLTALMGKKIQIEIGSTSTDFETYHGQTIPITFTDPSTGDPMTVYGGSLTLNEDGSADLVANMGAVDMGDVDWIFKNNSILRQRWAANINGMKVVSNSYPYPPNLLSSIFVSVKPNTTWQPYQMSYYDNQFNIVVNPNAYADKNELATALTGVPLVYELKTPRAYHFPNVGQLKAFLGENNVWSDIGNVNVKYLTQHSETGLEYRGDRALELRRRAMMADAPTIHTTVGSEETGGLASFKSYVKAPVKKIEIPFSPKQDLHGYDHPWPAGGGKNIFGGVYGTKWLLPTPITVHNGDTWTVTTSVPASGNPRINVYNGVNADNRVYNAGINDAVNNRKQKVITWVSEITITGILFDVAECTDIQIELGSTATNYAPYENICPIEGYDNCEVIDTNGPNLIPDDVDFVSGSWKPLDGVISASVYNAFCFRVPTGQLKWASDVGTTYVCLMDEPIRQGAKTYVVVLCSYRREYIFNNSVGHRYMAIFGLGTDGATAHEKVVNAGMSVSLLTSTPNPNLGKQTVLPLTFSQAGNHSFRPIQEGSGNPSPENVRPIHPGLIFTRDDDSVLTVWGGNLIVNSDGTGTLNSTWKRMDMSEFSSINGPSSTSGLYAHAFDMRNWTTHWDKAAGATNMICEVGRVQQSSSNYCVWGMSSTSDMYIYDNTISTVAEFKEKYAGYYVVYGTSTSTYHLSVTETNRALEALGLTQHIGPLYGGTITINPDGSADVVSEYRKVVYDGTTNPSYFPWRTYNIDGVTVVSALYPKYAVANRQKYYNANTVCSDCYSNCKKPDKSYGTPLNVDGFNFYSAPDQYSCAITFNQALVGDTTASLNSYLAENPVEIVYVLQTPTTYHFSNLEQLKVWLGENNFWCDISDDITVKYWNRG